MDVAFDNQDWAIAYALAAAGAERAHPDWDDLRARMRAARQAWQVSREARGTPRRSGSFDRGSAWQLAILNTHSAAVNQKDSADGNRQRDTYRMVAGLSSTGGRGLI